MSSSNTPRYDESFPTLGKQAPSDPLSQISQRTPSYMTCVCRIITEAADDRPTGGINRASVDSDNEYSESDGASDGPEDSNFPAPTQAPIVHRGQPPSEEFSTMAHSGVSKKPISDSIRALKQPEENSSAQCLPQVTFQISTALKLDKRTHSQPRMSAIDDHFQSEFSKYHRKETPFNSFDQFERFVYPFKDSFGLPIHTQAAQTACIGALQYASAKSPALSPLYYQQGLDSVTKAQGMNVNLPDTAFSTRDHLPMNGQDTPSYRLQMIREGYEAAMKLPSQQSVKSQTELKTESRYFEQKLLPHFPTFSSPSSTPKSSPNKQIFERFSNVPKGAEFGKGIQPFNPFQPPRNRPRSPRHQQLGPIGAEREPSRESVINFDLPVKPNISA